MGRKLQFFVAGLGRFGESVAVTLEKMGYDVMAMDIAEDVVQDLSDTLGYVVCADCSVGIEDNYVISVQSLEKEEDVLNHFRWLCDHEKEIKTKLEIKMETYKIKSYSAGDALKKLW